MSKFPFPPVPPPESTITEEPAIGYAVSGDVALQLRKKGLNPEDFTESVSKGGGATLYHSGVPVAFDPQVSGAKPWYAQGFAWYASPSGRHIGVEISKFAIAGLVAMGESPMEYGEDITRGSGNTLYRRGGEDVAFSGSVLGAVKGWAKPGFEWFICG